MAGWQTLSSENVYETPWIKVRRDEVLNHRGACLTYSVVELKHPSVFIYATNDQGQILMMRNYRYTLNRTVWEVPAGHSDGQNLLTAAKRELLEETGLASNEWTMLGTFCQASGIGNIPGAFFLASNAHPVNGARDELEEITDRQFMSIADIEALALDGKIEEAPFLAGLYLAKLHGLDKRKGA